MTTAVDSSALLAIFKDEPGASSFLNRIHEGLMQGEVVLCDIVVAEVGALFKDAEAFRAVLGKLGLQLDPIRFETACEAGRVFRAYRQAGGRRAAYRFGPRLLSVLFQTTGAAGLDRPPAPTDRSGQNLAETRTRSSHLLETLTRVGVHE